MSSSSVKIEPIFGSYVTTLEELKNEEQALDSELMSVWIFLISKTEISSLLEIVNHDGVNLVNILKNVVAKTSFSTSSIIPVKPIFVLLQMFAADVFNLALLFNCWKCFILFNIPPDENGKSKPIRDKGIDFLSLVVKCTIPWDDNC